MLFDERDENFVRERSRLPKFGIGTNDDIFFGHSPVEFNFLVRVGARLASWQNSAPATRNSVFSM